jgi:very-short-patch-repair endonuclease
MNGLGTAQHRQLPVGLLSAGWADGNRGENLVVEVLASAAVAPRFNAAGGVLDCHQQFPIGPYTLDFAWPKLRIGLEADGGIHQKTRCYTRDRRRDAWLREHGWLMFRVDVEKRALLPSQIRRVLDVVRATAPS